MGKKGSNSSNGKKGGESEACWSSNDFAIRKARKRRKELSEKQEERQRRSALLTRGSKEKQEESKLRLHIKRTQRQLENLKERLENWDNVAEAALLAKEEEERRLRRKEECEQPKKKKSRKGPESWKLKGAARPAHLVYDFDTRYIDPHIKAHEEAREKVKRCRNIIILGRGRFGADDNNDVPQPHCREYLSLLMQLGNLSMQFKQIKAARKYFLECMELDSSENPVTPARCQLMRLYMEANRPESARRLCESLPATDASVWIRYSAALIEFVSFHILKEKGSSDAMCELHLAAAIKANVFCAYYIAFFDTFSQGMEYTDDIEDATESSPLEEAIEYCNSEQMGAWLGTDGAMTWVRNFLVRSLKNDEAQGEQNMSLSDLDWQRKLEIVREKDANDRKSADFQEKDDNSSVDEDDDVADNVSPVDLEMYATMFETTMEMVESSGALK